MRRFEKIKKSAPYVTTIAVITPSHMTVSAVTAISSSIEFFFLRNKL